MVFQHIPVPHFTEHTVDPFLHNFTVLQARIKQQNQVLPLSVAGKHVAAPDGHFYGFLQVRGQLILFFSATALRVC